MFNDFARFPTISLVALSMVGCGNENGNIPGSQNNGTESDEETSKTQCENGKNPDGNGCLLLCDDGWSTGPNGDCIVDCPLGAVSREDGLCEIQSCPDGWRLETDGEIPFCAKNCPENMVAEGEDCIIPCSEGWSIGEDGRCHLDCPEGMVPTDDEVGCELVEVGENAECPDTPWNESFEGPNPIYVSQTLGTDSGDGSKDAPFATIAQAIEAAGTSATIYIAAGVYNEQIAASEKVELNIIGACAEDVMIAPETLPPDPDALPTAALHLVEIGSTHVSGITVVSPGDRGIEISYSNPTDTNPAIDAVVEQVVVQQALADGIVISGDFESIEVSDNSISNVQWGIACMAGESAITDPEASAKITVARNRINDLSIIGDPEYFAAGIVIGRATEAIIGNNHLSDIVQSRGVLFIDVLNMKFNKNIFYNISGDFGISISSTGVSPAPSKNQGSFVFEENIFGNLTFEQTPNTELGVNQLFTVYVSFSESVDLMLQKNRFSNIGGIVLGPTVGPNSEIAISKCEFQAVDSGFAIGSGRVNVSGNRFYNVGMVGFATEAQEFSFLENSITGSATHEYAMSYLGIDKIQGTIILEGNSIYDISDIDNRWNAVAISALSSSESQDTTPVMIRSNSFATLSGDQTCLYLSNISNSIEVSDNLFQSVETAIRPAFTNDMYLTIENSYFSNVTESVTSFAEGDLQNTSMTLLNNVFFNTYCLWGSTESSEVDRFDAKQNTFIATVFAFTGASELNITQNLMISSEFFLGPQNEGTSTQIMENRGYGTGVALEGLFGPTSLINNGWYLDPLSLGFSLAYRVGIFRSPGPIQVDHNIIVGSHDSLVFFEGVGELSDGIHVVGEPGGPPCHVEITRNIVRDNARFGILLAYSEGLVENNMYLNNLEQDLVVQSPSSEGVSGSDTLFAETPEEPYGVILPEMLP